MKKVSSYPSIIEPVLELVPDNCPSVLDVGCSDGKYGMLLFHYKRPNLLVGVDQFVPHLREARRHRYYDALIRADCRVLPFRDRSHNIVVCVDVIEHLPKQDGPKIFRELFRVSRQRIILTTPNGFDYRPPEDGHSDPFRGHASGYTASDLRGYGFKVRGIGALMWRAQPDWLPSLIRYLAIACISGLSRFIPQLSHTLLCIAESSSMDNERKGSAEFPLE